MYPEARGFHYYVAYDDTYQNLPVVLPGNPLEVSEFLGFYAFVFS